MRNIVGALDQRIAQKRSLFLVIVFCIAGVFFLWLAINQAREDVELLATASTDNVQWSAAQIEVEFLVFENQIADSLLSPEIDNQPLRRRFDILYSRTRILRASPMFRETRIDPEVSESLAEVSAFLDRWVLVIDDGDEAIEDRLEQLKQEASDLHPLVRNISLGTIEAFAGRGDTTREHATNMLVQLGSLVSFMLFTLISIVAILIYMMERMRRKNSEISRTHNQLQAIIATSLDGILVADRSGKVIDYNGAATRIFGYSRERAIGSSIGELIVPENMIEAHHKGMERYRKTGEKKVVGAGPLKLEARRKDGSIFPTEATISSYISDEGEIFVSFFRDITNQELAKKELVEARDKALAGEKAKEELILVMSHEMRTPLNGVLGSLEVLADTKLSAKQKKLLEVVDTSANLLLSHVNNVLEISRVNSGRLKLDQAPLDILTLTSELVLGQQARAEARGNTLVFESDDTMPPLVLGDRNRISQILLNLIENAIKFTKDGSIRVVLSKASDHELKFEIKDTGVGIAKEDHVKIFSEFVTLDRSFMREAEGTGLGLGIVHRLVSLMGGELGVDSALGKGSNFWFTLPLRSSSQSEANSRAQLALKAVEPNYAGARVLLVEDNQINRVVANEMLKKFDCDVEEAHNGIMGVELAETRPYDLILMDISMPKMAGTTASEKIRSSSGPNAKTPIVALTAHASDRDREKFLSAGMNEVLLKPISLLSLEKTLKNFLNGNTMGQKIMGENCVYAELCKTLGDEQAAVVFSKVQAELQEGLDALAQMMREDASNKNIAGLSHKIAGSAAVVGLNEMREALLEIEAAAKEKNRHALGPLLAKAASVFTSVETP